MSWNYFQSDYLPTFPILYIVVEWWQLWNFLAYQVKLKRIFIPSKSTSSWNRTWVTQWAVIHYSEKCILEPNIIQPPILQDCNFEFFWQKLTYDTCFESPDTAMDIRLHMVTK